MVLGMVVYIKEIPKDYKNYRKASSSICSNASAMEKIVVKAGDNSSELF